MSAHNTRWLPKPGHIHCRLCTIRLDHPEIAVAGNDPTLCADCEEHQATQLAAGRLVTTEEATEILGVSLGTFYRVHRQLLETSSKSRARNLFRLADVQRLAAQYAAGD